jgi:hypothetical protein
MGWVGIFLPISMFIPALGNTACDLMNAGGTKALAGSSLHEVHWSVPHYLYLLIGIHVHAYDALAWQPNVK